MAKVSKNDINNEAQAGLMITGFLGTVTLFFTGILIAQFNNFNNSIKVPILYLIVATFALVFSAVIYANATGALTANKLKKSSKYMVIANSLSEYLGVYLFVIAIPMVISAISTDQFLRLSVAIVTILSIFLYTVSAFSIFNRSFSKALNVLFAFILSFAMSALYFSQLNLEAYYSYIAIGLFLLLIITAIFSEERRVGR